MMIRAMRLPWKVQEIFDRICSCSCVILIFVWGKVMLLHLSVCSEGLRGLHPEFLHSKGVWIGASVSKGRVEGSPCKGLCMEGGSALSYICLSPGVLPPGGLPPGGSALGGGQTPPELEKRVVLILLECFLVLILHKTTIWGLSN